MGDARAAVSKQTPSTASIKDKLKAEYDAIGSLIVSRQATKLRAKFTAISLESMNVVDEYGRRMKRFEFILQLESSVKQVHKIETYKTSIESITPNSITPNGNHVIVKLTTSSNLEIPDPADPKKSKPFSSVVNRIDTWKWVQGTWKLEEMAILKTVAKPR
jgi:hypothetical protein